MTQSQLESLIAASLSNKHHINHSNYSHQSKHCFLFMLFVLHNCYVMLLLNALFFSTNTCSQKFFLNIKIK